MLKSSIDLVHVFLLDFRDQIDTQLPAVKKAIGTTPDLLDVLGPDMIAPHPLHAAFCAVIEVADGMFDEANPRHAILAQALLLTVSFWVLNRHVFCGE